MYSFVNVCIWNIKQFVLELRVENGVLYLLELVLIAPMIVVHLHIISNGEKNVQHRFIVAMCCAQRALEYRRHATCLRYLRGEKQQENQRNQQTKRKNSRSIL